MTSLDQLFASATLDVVAPDTTVEFPPKTPLDSWLERLKAKSANRDQTFFDEKLRILLTVRIPHPSPVVSTVDATRPPPDLVSLITHLQVSLEATYINPYAEPPPPSAPMLSAPRKSSPHHPSIFPPTTPNPLPSSTDQDRRYVQSEGTLLLAWIWGQVVTEDEAFYLSWSEHEQVWIAVYQLHITLKFSSAFLRLTFSDPLLCLTLSTTLREKSLVASITEHPLLTFFRSLGNSLIPSPGVSLPTTPVNGQQVIVVEQPEIKPRYGPEEANLLDGLAGNPSFSADADSLSLPSTRLGPNTRRGLYALAPLEYPSPATPSPSPLTVLRSAHPTMRKSFRRTLAAVSGFRVRMRTVFVPAVLLPEDVDGEIEQKQERLAAGDAERSVVLCVEIDNSGEAGSGVGFAVEKVDISVSPARSEAETDATAMFIGWGDALFPRSGKNELFPINIGEKEQWNLIYALSFLKSPFEDEVIPISGRQPHIHPGLQRAVTINIIGKPYVVGEDLTDPVYPTSTFSSRWNCVLDLNLNPNRRLEAVSTVAEPYMGDEPSGNKPANVDILPEPPSPFPVSPATIPRRPSTPLSAGSVPPLTAGGVPIFKRHTLPTHQQLPRSLKTISTPIPPIRSRRTSLLSVKEQRDTAPASPPRASYIPPSKSQQAQFPRSPTTYEVPPLPPQFLSIASPPSGSTSSTFEGQSQMPTMPAYPPLTPGPRSAFAVPPTPNVMSQTQTESLAGPSVEIRRERGFAVGIGSPNAGGVIPPTPGPTVSGFHEPPHLPLSEHLEDAGANNMGAIVVSVGLLSEAGSNADAIYPLDSFTLDIFIFNRSNWTRRFEISCPSGGGRGIGVGIVSLNNRVRVGPLRPCTCQSVRMEFIAMAPGVHCIDVLTVKDMESGAKVNLRYVCR
ncbi:hypothetical protein FISHEDRAFT_64538 [Fistulina hepatica ATCC 64428]|nr:hypothetical protein FISHEDRAFT_64538 [Fistulina hepatica ATCC 64428]